MFMREQAARIGLEFKRIKAVDALNVPDDLAGYFAHILKGKPPIIDNGAVGCYASHLKTLKIFDESNEPAALILEDDALLPANIMQILNDMLATLPSGWDFVHLAKPPVRAYKPIAVLPCGRRLVRYSRMPPGAAGYLISKAGAVKLLNKSIPRFWPIDTDTRRPWVFGHDAYGIVPPPIQQLPMPTMIPRMRRSARRGLPRPTRFSWTNTPFKTPASFVFNLRQLGLTWWVRCTVFNAGRRLGAMVDRLEQRSPTGRTSSSGRPQLMKAHQGASISVDSIAGS